MDEKDIIKQYGEVGTNQVYCKLPYRMRLAWDKKVTISKFQCHAKVKDKLEAIFKEVLEYYGIIQIQALGLDIFGGCLNIRAMRGGYRPSVHSWGLAVDLDPENNQLKWKKDKARFARPEYNKFWEIVEKHGGLSLGRTRDYDWMHFQFIPID